MENHGTPIMIWLLSIQVFQELFFLVTSLYKELHPAEVLTEVEGAMEYVIKKKKKAAIIANLGISTSCTGKDCNYLIIFSYFYSCVLYKEHW